MNTSHDHPAYQEGRKSYFSNKGKYANPYPSGSIEHDIFERGWSQALKRIPVAKACLLALLRVYPSIRCQLSSSIK